MLVYNNSRERIIMDKKELNRNLEKLKNEVDDLWRSL